MVIINFNNIMLQYFYIVQNFERQLGWKVAVDIIRLDMELGNCVL